MSFSNKGSLEADHQPHRIRQRLEGVRNDRRLADAVLGGIDGCVTSFAIVCAALGAGLTGTVALILGLANLLADGVSMAVSNFEAARAEQSRYAQLRRTEGEHIDRIPDGETEEIRQIFSRKGFRGELLEAIVTTVTSNRSLWLDTMLHEEHGLSVNTGAPWHAGLMTFCCFVLAGLVPLLPFALARGDETPFLASSLLAGIVFFSIGLLKSLVIGAPVLRAAFGTLLTGGFAAGLAFATGYGLRHLAGLA